MSKIRKVLKEDKAEARYWMDMKDEAMREIEYMYRELSDQTSVPEYRRLLADVKKNIDGLSRALDKMIYFVEKENS